MTTDTNTQLLQIIENYESVINKFKSTSAVNIGEIGFKRDGVNVAEKDRPRSAGYGFGTTGYCVSASKALLEFIPFQQLLQYRGAQAKLISIDIKEQYYGVCYNGSQNYWHTAILVGDYVDGKRYNFVIDITVRQFGDAFVNKDFWSLETWTNKLRSATCTHKLTDFDGNESSLLPVNETDCSEDFKTVNEIQFVTSVNELKRNIMLTGNDRSMIVDFVYKKMDNLNSRLLLGQPTNDDLMYMRDISTIISKLYFKSNIEPLYSVLKFKNKTALANWTKLFTYDESLPQYLLLFNDATKACKYHNIDVNDINNICNNNDAETHYLILEFKPNSIYVPSIESSSIDGIAVYNTKLKVTYLANVGKETVQSFGIQKTFNTIKCVVEQPEA